MKPLTGEWVTKAENDFQGALLLQKAGVQTHTDLICYLSEQCAEKYLKACLQEASVAFPKTHDLRSLLKRMLPYESAWVAFDKALNSLSRNATEVRYPGFFASVTDANEALATTALAREACRKHLGLPTV